MIRFQVPLLRQLWLFAPGFMITAPVPMNLRATLLSDCPQDQLPCSLAPVSLKFAPVGELPEILELDITIDVSP